MDEVSHFDTDGRPDIGSGIIQIRNILSIPEVLLDFGLVPEKILTKAGLGPGTFSDPNGIMTISALGRLLTECVQAARCDDFGLRVGIRQDASNIGLAGLAAINAATVADALHVVSTHLKRSETGIALRVERSNGTATASLTLLNPDLESGDQLTDGSAADLCNFMRQLLGSRWCPVAVLLTRSRPQNTRIFAEFFRAPIQYDSSECAIVFDSLELKRPVPGRNEKHFEILMAALEQGGREDLGSFKAEIKSVMRRQIASGPLTLARTAAAFNLAKRTFARQIEHAGLTFSALVEEVKYETARSLLRRRMKLSEISAVLGYAEASVFTRSFKRWSGETPKSWRLKHADPRPSGPANSMPILHDEHQHAEPPDAAGSARL